MQGEGLKGRQSMKLKMSNVDKKAVRKLLKALEEAGIENPLDWIEQQRKNLVMARYGEREGQTS